MYILNSLIFHLTKGIIKTKNYIPQGDNHENLYELNPYPLNELLMSDFHPTIGINYKLKLQDRP